MLTQKDLDDMFPQEKFATGLAVDKPGDLHLAGTGKVLRWVAVRGGFPDWAIYAYFDTESIYYVARHGDKVQSEEHIRRLVPCMDEAYRSYRH